MLVSVLNIWGQNEYDISSYQKEINSLRSLNDTVLQQNYVQKKDPEWVRNTTELLDSLFQTANDLIRISDSLSDEEKKEVAKQLENFCREYKKAIYDSNQTQVQIESDKFEERARKYKDIFESWVKQQQTDFDAKKLRQPETNQQEEPQEDYGKEEEPSKTKEYSKAQVIFILMMGILGVLSVVAFSLSIWFGAQVSSLRKQIGELKGEMQRMELEKVNKEKKSKVNENITTLPPSTPAKSTHSSKQNEKETTTQASKQDVVVESRPITVTTTQKTVKPVVVAQPVYLYAKANASANTTEVDFFKLSEKESQEHVFRLCLQNAGDEVASFTVKPNVARDYILEHEIYFPPAYCNKKEIKSAQPTAIDVINEGKAKKVNGKWIVSEPVSIRLV